MSIYIDDNIEVLRRPILYKKLIDYVRNSASETIDYEIKVDEEFNHELVAYRIYKNSDLRWIVAVMTNNTDEFQRLPVGFTVRFPPLQVIASLIREVKDSAA